MAPGQVASRYNLGLGDMFQRKTVDKKTHIQDIELDSQYLCVVGFKYHIKMLKLHMLNGYLLQECF